MFFNGVLHTALEINNEERDLLLKLQGLNNKDSYSEFKALPNKLFDIIIDELDMHHGQQMKGQKLTARACSQNIRRPIEMIIREVC